MDALLLNEVEGRDRFELGDLTNDTLLDRRSDAASEVLLADCRELRGAVGFEKVRRDNRRNNLGCGADLADEDGGLAHA